MKKYDSSYVSKKFTDHIKYKLQASLFMLCQNMSEIKNTALFAPYAAPDGYDLIKETLICTMENLRATLSSGAESRTGEIEKLKAVKSTFLDMCESFYGYLSLNAILMELTAYQKTLGTVSCEDELSIDFAAFLRDTERYIEKSCEEGRMERNAAFMMKCYPLFMTKAKYGEYIERSLDLLFGEESEGIISSIIGNLKSRFMPLGLKSYGAFFPDLKELYGDFTASDIGSMAQDELDSFFDRLDNSFHELEQVSGQLYTVHESLNFAILILSFAVSLDYLLDETAAYKDAYYYCIENIRNGSDDMLDGAPSEMYEAVLSELTDKIIADEKNGLFGLSQDKMARYGDDAVKLSALANLISELYYEILPEVLYAARESVQYGAPADNAFKEAAKKDVTDYIEHSLSLVPERVRKDVRRIFFSCIPSPYTPDEFMDYASYAINNTNDYRKKMALLNTVSDLFDNAGLGPAPEDDFDE